MNRSRAAQWGREGSTRSTPPYRLASSSAIEKEVPTWLLFARWVIRRTWRRTACASFLTSAAESMPSGMRSGVLAQSRTDQRSQGQEQYRKVGFDRGGSDVLEAESDLLGPNQA